MKKYYQYGFKEQNNIFALLALQTRYECDAKCNKAMS